MYYIYVTLRVYNVLCMLPEGHVVGEAAEEEGRRGGGAAGGCDVADGGALGGRRIINIL